MVIVQLFVPFTIGGRKNKAEAVGAFRVVTSGASYLYALHEGFQVFVRDANIADDEIKLKADISLGTEVLETVYPSSSRGSADAIQVSNDVSGYDTLLRWTARFTTRLSPGTTYRIRLYIGQREFPITARLVEFATNGDYTLTSDEDVAVVTVQETTIATGEVARTETQTFVSEEEMMPACELTKAGTWIGCIGRLFYWIIFQPSSKLFALTGRLLDVSVAYSLSNTSYSSVFVTEGWAVIRDFCNMFFIFILLYIAFGTILGIHGVKTKEMIINVIIIGLLINFSLFAVRLIVDASNIMTRVFYNSNTIQIGTVVDGEFQEQLGSQQEIKLSEALVAKINPQKLILGASEVGTITTKQQVVQEGTESNTGNGISGPTFLLVTLLASVINIVGLITFLLCSLLFIARVISLWIAMIFAPLAFFSYTIPAMQNWEMVGWKKWWPETLKVAFMAPVFVFFMYLIIKFLDPKVMGLFTVQTKDGLDFLLGIFIPFIFIMVLLLKAKDISKSMSGKIGQSIVNTVKSIGGVALGAGLGAVAGVGVATLGRAGSAVASSETLKKAEAKGGVGGFAAKQLRNIGSFTGKGSMDVRSIKIGGKDLSSVLGAKTGKVKEGGFIKARQEQVEKRVKRAKELEVGEDAKMKQDLNAVNNELKILQNTSAEELAIIDKDIAKKRQKLDDASKAFGASSNQAEVAGKILQNAVDKRNALIKGEEYRGDMETRDVEKTKMVNTGVLGNDGKPLMREEKYIEQEVVLKSDAKPVNYSEKYKLQKDENGQVMSLASLEKEAKRLENQIIRENNERRQAYAGNISSGMSQTVNFITSGGQLSLKGVGEATAKIISGVKEEKS